MPKKTVDCIDCKHLVPPILKEPDNYFSKIIKKECCDLGFRIMYRKPKNQFEYGGYFRKCSSFSSNKLQ